MIVINSAAQLSSLVTSRDVVVRWISCGSGYSDANRVRKAAYIKVRHMDRKFVIAIVRSDQAIKGTEFSVIM